MEETKKEEPETKIKAPKIKAEDVVQKPEVKVKMIPLPPKALIEVNRLISLTDKYIAGVVAGMQITGPWGFDYNKRQLVVHDPEEL